MSGFVYYLPKVQTLTRDEAGRRGFDYALDGRELFTRGVMRGPEGQGSGVVFADPGRVQQGQIGFWPERQTWKRVPAADAWIGTNGQGSPGPADLARREQLPGHQVELLDGNKWLAPIARGVYDAETLQPYCPLPTELTMDDDGKWRRGEVIAKYAELWRRALAFWDVWWGEILGDASAPKMSDGELCDLALFSLGVNYVVGPGELRMLGLFDDTSRSRILGALVDWPVIEDWLKKKQQDAAGE